MGRKNLRTKNIISSTGLKRKAIDSKRQDHNQETNTKQIKNEHTFVKLNMKVDERRSDKINMSKPIENDFYDETFDSRLSRKKEDVIERIRQNCRCELQLAPFEQIMSALQDISSDYCYYSLSEEHIIRLLELSKTSFAPITLEQLQEVMKNKDSMPRNDQRCQFCLRNLGLKITTENQEEIPYHKYVIQRQINDFSILLEPLLPNRSDYFGPAFFYTNLNRKRKKQSWHQFIARSANQSYGIFCEPYISSPPGSAYQSVYQSLIYHHNMAHLHSIDYSYKVPHISSTADDYFIV